jgi:hypothetical protein
MQNGAFESKHGKGDFRATASWRTAGDSEGEGEGDGVIDDVSLGVDVCDGDEVTLSEGLLLGVSLGVGAAVAVDVALSVTVYLRKIIPPDTYGEQVHDVHAHRAHAAHPNVMQCLRGREGRIVEKEGWWPKGVYLCPSAWGPSGRGNTVNCAAQLKSSISETWQDVRCGGSLGGSP